MDGAAGRRGKPDWEKTHFYVPNDYLFRVVRAHPQSMVPCVSINPERGDAIAELDRWADQGVRALKIHPPTQGVDLADKLAVDRRLHGSDFPFPSAPAAFAPVTGVRKALGLQAVENRLDQDYLLKEALGIGLLAARRAHRLICGET